MPEFSKVASVSVREPESSSRAGELWLPNQVPLSIQRLMFFGTAICATDGNSVPNSATTSVGVPGAVNGVALEEKRGQKCVGIRLGVDLQPEGWVGGVVERISHGQWAVDGALQVLSGRRVDVHRYPLGTRQRVAVDIGDVYRDMVGTLRW